MPDETPEIETTRQAIIAMLVKFGVIGAREAVDRLITAVETKGKTHALAKELYEHLEYCGWGDRWEREISSDLRKKTLAEFAT